MVYKKLTIYICTHFGVVLIQRAQQHVGAVSMLNIYMHKLVYLPIYYNVAKRGKMVLLLLTPICCRNKKLMSVVGSAFGNMV